MGWSSALPDEGTPSMKTSIGLCLLLALTAATVEAKKNECSGSCVKAKLCSNQIEGKCGGKKVCCDGVVDKCAKKSATSRCLKDGHGNCKGACGEGETPVLTKGKHLCKGKKCVCCAPSDSGHGPTASPHWSYAGETGPAQWASMGYSLCGGQSQSPIDLHGANHVTSHDPLVFTGYDHVPHAMTIKNNGHSAVVSSSDLVASVRGGELGDEYTFAQFHFHWGSTDHQGSEHTVDGHQYPMELHLVHFNAKYHTIGDALQHPDGLAVLGVFLEVSGHDNPALTPLVDALAGHTSKNTAMGEDIALAQPIALHDLLPADVSNFYRYQGSLTTPTCNEIVTWTVFQSTIEISEHQLDAFRVLVDDEGHALVDNFRPVQDLHGRTIELISV